MRKMTKTRKKVHKLRKRRVSRKINRRLRKKRLNKTRRLHGGNKEEIERILGEIRLNEQSLEILNNTTTNSNDAEEEKDINILQVNKKIKELKDQLKALEKRESEA